MKQILDEKLKDVNVKLVQISNGEAHLYPSDACIPKIFVIISRICKICS